MDVTIRALNDCMMYRKHSLLNAVSGMVLGMAIVGLMTRGGSGKFLFFNDVQGTRLYVADLKSNSLNVLCIKMENLSPNENILVGK